MSNGTAHYVRVNFLIAAAFVIVIVCLAVTVWITISDEFAKGIVTLVLGRYLGYVDNIYNFEFGTTRSSTKKDESIAELTKTAATVATTAQATQVASDIIAAAATASPGPLKTETVEVTADTANVTTGEPKS